MSHEKDLQTQLREAFSIDISMRKVNQFLYEHYNERYVGKLNPKEHRELLVKDVSILYHYICERTDIPLYEKVPLDRVKRLSSLPKGDIKSYYGLRVKIKRGRAIYYGIFKGYDPETGKFFIKLDEGTLVGGIRKDVWKSIDGKDTFII